jgi:7-carboxy-7-deazaguanine synthase
LTYAIKELFYTLQGEGTNAGRSAVFCRFSRCNLWSGREADRDKAICQFCDTDFVGTDGPGGGLFRTAESLAIAARQTWNPQGGSSADKPFVVCTGGEPLLQLDVELIGEFHRQGFEVAIETNGTLPVPDGVDWVCVSPKARSELVVTEGDELKLVYPQADGDPERYEGLAFSNYFLQPMDGPLLANNTCLAVNYCLEHPHWRLGIQTHKYLGIP